jgi:hypothetical protein
MRVWRAIGKSMDHKPPTWLVFKVLCVLAQEPTDWQQLCGPQWKRYHKVIIPRPSSPPGSIIMQEKRKLEEHKLPTSCNLLSHIDCNPLHCTYLELMLAMLIKKGHATWSCRLKWLQMYTLQLTSYLAGDDILWSTSHQCMQCGIFFAATPRRWWRSLACPSHYYKKRWGIEVTGRLQSCTGLDWTGLTGLDPQSLILCYSVPAKDLRCV